MGKVIGFLTYQDFVNELFAELESIGPVRVQDYAKTERDVVVGSRFCVYLIDVATECKGDLYVCRFKFSGGHTYEDELIERCRQRALLARRLLDDHLNGNGFDARRGMFARAVEFSGETNPSGLWHYEDGGELVEGDDERD